MEENKVTMEQKIGAAAGEIWNCLNEKGEMSVTKLKRAVDVKERIFYMSLGWLARENKLRFVQGRTGLRVELR